MWPEQYSNLNCIEKSPLQIMNQIAMVPLDYHHVLHDALMGIAATATKLFSACTTVAQWLQHQAAGMLPPHLRLAMPEVQLMNEFPADPTHATHTAIMWVAHQKYQEALLTNHCSQAGWHYLLGGITHPQVFTHLNVAQHLTMPATTSGSH
jgi:hypothetical protein